MKKNRQIRVFISSTFVDMQAEREHLTRVIFPRLRKLCANRGVSFYAIDLRWGITEDESRRNRTVEICLDQIKQCIPYFIGLIGNRYGWIPEGDFSAQYPWLREHPGISATEMEIRYYLREAMEDKTRALFAIKGTDLLDLSYDDGQSEKLQTLTRDITEQIGLSPIIYNSMEALGEAVYQNILAVLDREFPAEECTPEHLLEQYIHQIEHYDDSRALEEMERENWSAGGNRFLFARRDPAAFDVMENALLRFQRMILLEVPGMEQLCNRYLHQTIHGPLSWSNPQLIGICIMADAAQYLRTPLGIMETLCKRLTAYVPEQAHYPWPDNRSYGVNRLRQLVTVAVRMLQDILKERQMLICISNLHLLDRNSPWYTLSFLAPLIRSGLRLVLTTADPEQATLLQQLGMPCRNFPIQLAVSEKAGFFASMIRCFELEGKHLDADLADDLIESKLLCNMETASFVGNYLKNFVIFPQLSQQIRQLIAISEKTDAYHGVWQCQLDRLKEKEGFDAKQNEAILSLTGRIYRVIRSVRMPEADLDRIFTETGTSRILFMEALDLLRPFLVYDGSALCIYSPSCRQALDDIFRDVPCVGEAGLTDVIMDKQMRTWPCLDDQYALISYLHEHKDHQQLTRLVTDNRWLEFAILSDVQLIRMAWRALEDLGALDIKKIYSESGHLSALCASREIYDVLMRMELAVTGTDHFECFLDIPFVYSTDSEKELKESWSLADRRAVSAFKELSGEESAAQLRDMYRQYCETEGMNPFAAVYIWQILCNILAERKEMEADDRNTYLQLAARVCAPRLIADALGYLQLVKGPFRLLR